MLVLRLLRFIFGYVSFAAKGGFPERFINLCRQNRIALWDLKSENAVISARTDVSSYKRIRKAAKKSGMKVKISKKHGLPFFLNRHSRRMGLIAGMLICASVLMILSTRIWRIEVIGNFRIPTQEILQVFEELGVRAGAPVSSIDEWTVEQAAIKKLPEISWVNVNLTGSAAQIEVREVIEQKKVDNSETPANIVAAKDGQIVYLRPFKGTQEKKIGTGVVKGDLLISGFIEYIDMSTGICRADGYVVARTDYLIEVESKNKKKIKILSNTQTSYSVEFLSFRIPLGRQNSGFEEKSSLYLNGAVLPFAFVRRNEDSFADREITLSKEKNIQLARLDFYDKAVNEYRYKKVEKAEIEETETKDGYKIKGSFTCLENIGEKQPFEVVEE